MVCTPTTGWRGLRKVTCAIEGCPIPSIAKGDFTVVCRLSQRQRDSGASTSYYAHFGVVVVIVGFANRPDWPLSPSCPEPVGPLWILPRKLTWGGGVAC